MNPDEKTQRIEKLKKQIANCQRCALSKTRTHTVPGEGDILSKIMFIGEAPGRNEDLEGRPFVGKAGKVFDQLLASIGLTRQDIYLCNILKCRPPENRNPLDHEIKACVGSLDIQLKIIDPIILATLGKFSTEYICQKFSVEFTSISSLHGKILNVKQTTGVRKIIPLFHPAVVTYNASKLEILLNDFKNVKVLLDSLNLDQEFCHR